MKAKLLRKFKNDHEYLEAAFDFKIDNENYELNEEGKLIELNLSGHGISKLLALESLTTLKNLYLSHNDISDISPLSNLTSLTELDLSHNDISDISPLSNLTSLTELDLSHNEINNIEALSNLTSLLDVNLSHNEINNIEALSNLTSLLDVNLSYNEINNIEALSNLTSLLDLNLSHNEINDISSLSNLTSLKELYVNGNGINNITPLSKFTQLDSLNLDGNDFIDTTSLSKLSLLKWLSIGDNNIINIDFLVDLKLLEILYLEENNIKDINVLSSLKLLQELYISENLIEDIECLSNLKFLKSLDISNNFIIDISPLSNLKFLNELGISNNPINNVPGTILKSSAQEIIRWLQENEVTKEKVILNDVKVLLLGNTNIGKSNLLFLWEQWYKTPRSKKKYPLNSDSTHGLVYKEFSKNKKEQNIPLLHIWDFGGQEYFHATHQLFFSPDALHVLLWSKNPLETRKEKEEVFELDYWLRCSEQLSKDESPIEMVLIENRIDYTGEKEKLEFYSHFPEKKYIDKFNIYSPYEQKERSDKPPFMLNICSVSLKHKKRLKGMFELLEERIEMLHQKNLHPPKYAEIRDVLDSSTRKYWTLNLYTKRFKEKDNVILKTLHRLGCLLYFHEQLPNKIFTKPKLLLNLIYDDILNEKLQDNQGKITNEFEIAAKNKDLKLKVPELETLLSSFKLIFKTKDNTWYAPQYLPEDSPSWLQLLKDYTFEAANIIVSSDHYLMNTILLDIFSEYGDVIKKDKSYMFWQKGLVIEKDGQLLLVEYDRKQMRLLLYGDQQEKNQQLQKEVVDFIIKIIHKDDASIYELESKGEEIDRIGFKNFELKSKTKDANSKNISWATDKVKIGVSIDGKYYINVQELHENVQNKIYTIKAFHYDDETSFKAFSVFQFNQYLDEKDQGILKKVTISYSKDDLKLVNEFIKNLVPLHDDGLIENPWYCSQLEAGTEWNKEIQEQFNQADIIFFMVSPNFLATKYIKEHEIKTAIARRQQEIEDKIAPNRQVKIIPIILDFCRWYRKDAKYDLGKYTALPYTAKPVVDFKNRNMAWYIIEEAIRVAIEKDNDPDFDTTLSKEVKKIYERIMAREVDDDNDNDE